MARNFLKRWCAKNDNDHVEIVEDNVNVEFHSLKSDGVWRKIENSKRTKILHQETIHNPDTLQHQSFGIDYDLQANYDPKVTTDINGFETQAKLRYGDTASLGQLRVAKTISIPPDKKVNVQIEGNEIREEMGITVEGLCSGGATVNVRSVGSGKTPQLKTKEGKAYDIFKRFKEPNITSHFRDGSFFFNQRGKVARNRLESHSLYIDGDNKFTRTVPPH